MKYIKLMLMMALVSCASKPPLPTSIVETAAAARSVEASRISTAAALIDAKEIKTASGRIDQGLSRMDGKAEVIKQWFLQRRNTR